MRSKAFYIGKRLLKNELVNGSVYLFLGSLTSSLLAFFINLFFARNLSTSDYGIYASLLSLLALTTIPSQSLISVITRFAADFISNNKIIEASYFYKKSFKFMFLISLFLFFIFAVFTKTISGFLKIDNSYYILIVGLIVFFQYLYIVNSAYLQSFLKFIFMSFNTILIAFSKLIFGVVLVFLGYKVFGALIAILISFIVPILTSFIPLKKLLRKTKKFSMNLNYKEVLEYALPTTATILALTSFMSIDVILVKHFFTSTQAGLYGGLSLIGKVIFYFTGAIPLVMFPLLIKRHSKGENINNLFYLALLLVTAPSIAITSFYFLFPEFTINLFLGKGYYELIPYLGLFGLFITIYSTLNVFVNFFLSIKKTIIFIPVIFFTFLQIILIYLFHDNFYQIIGISMICTLMLLAVLIIYFIKEFFKFSILKSTISSFNNSLN